MNLRRFQPADAGHVWALSRIPNVGHTADPSAPLPLPLLVSALEEAASELGFHQLHLDTASNQPEAVAFYRSLGYEEIGRGARPEWS